MLTIGSLFSGYGGLDLAVESVTGAITAWHCEYEAAPSKILAHHWPGVPNLGDITAVDWDAVEPVDILTGGSPCQDLSHAGRRAGMTDGTRSNLWVAMREAIARLRPRLVVWENVRGAYSACADSASDSELGRCPRCVDPDSGLAHDPNLRALGRVLGDLSDLGYDAQWHGLSASDVGAPHGRFRVFVVATDATGRRGERWRDAPRQPHWASDLSTRRSANAPADTESSGDPIVALIDDGGSLGGAEPGAGGGDCAGHPAARVRRLGAGAGQEWGQYAAAIRRWEHIIGRPAPAPTEPGPKGGQRLSARFVEWLMGLDAGWVTDPAIWEGMKPSTARNAQLKALGNGVVPQQAAEAVASMLTVRDAEVRGA